MRHALARLTGLLIVLTLALTGCNLIGVDPIMQLDEDMVKLQREYSVAVATYDGGAITKGEVMANFLYQYSSYYSMYSQLGMSLTSATVDEMRQSIVANAVQGVAIEKEFANRGLTLSEEKLAEIEGEVEEHYQEALASYLENAQGDTDAVKAKQAEYDMYADGYTREMLETNHRQEAKRELLEEAVKGEITEVSDEELNAAYETKVADDEAKYDGGYSAFESAMTSDGETVYWVPEGYRTVKHILIIPGEDVLGAVTSARTAYADAQAELEGYEAELDALNDDDAEDAEETAEPRAAEAIQADIDRVRGGLDDMKAEVEAAEAACLASVQDKLDDIYARLEAGEDFAALIDAYGEDPGMQNEPTRTRGYYVCANSGNWDQNFTDGAMALQAVGDYTQPPVIGASGIHIIRYESDVTPGALPLEDVRDALYEETLESMKEEHLSDALTSWTEALNPQYNLSPLTIGD